MEDEQVAVARQVGRSASEALVDLLVAQCLELERQVALPERRCLEWQHQAGLAQARASYLAEAPAAEAG